MTATPSLLLSLLQSGGGDGGETTPLVESGMSLGLPIAGAGLMIVFLALMLISLFIAALPYVVEMLATIVPETDGHHGDSTQGSTQRSNQGHPESLVPDDSAVLAAIGFVLHTELQRHVSSAGGTETADATSRQTIK